MTQRRNNKQNAPAPRRRQQQRAQPPRNQAQVGPPASMRNSLEATIPRSIPRVWVAVTDNLHAVVMSASDLVALKPPALAVLQAARINIQCASEMRYIPPMMQAGKLPQHGKSITTAWIPLVTFLPMTVQCLGETTNPPVWHVEFFGTLSSV